MSATPSRHRRAQIGCVVLGVALVLPSIAGGFIADDYLQIAQIEGWSITPTGPLDLYSFVPRDPAAVERLRAEGVVPYFTAPGLKIVFWRPLSSALMQLDHALFGRHAWPYHLHTLLWYAALLVVTAALLRRTLPPAMATLAVLLFCLDDAHAMAAGWIAARNATVACAFVFLALLAHIRWRTQGWRPGVVLGPVAAALGLAAGETALGALAYLFAWELAERRPRRARALAPWLALVAIYLVVHRVTGAGARGSGAYLDPIGDPLGFVRALPERVLLLLGNLLLGSPIDFLLFDESVRPLVLGLGAAAVLVVVFWLPRALRRMPPEEAAAVRWFGLGAAGALLVSTPALLGERVLLAASLGGAVVLAALLRDGWRRLRERRAVALLGVAALGLSNIAVAAAALAGKSIFFPAMSQNARRLAREAEISAPVPARVVVLALEDLLALHLPVIRVFEQNVPAERLRGFRADRARGALPLPDWIGYQGTTVLSLAATEHRLRRTAADTFELSTPNATMLDGAWAQSVRAPSIPLARGSVIALPFMTATVLEDRGGRPTRVSFRFLQPLDDPSLVFLVLSGDRLRKFAMPGIGAEVDVPRGRPLASGGRSHHD
jgi:hypothetical protein